VARHRDDSHGSIPYGNVHPVVADEVVLGFSALMIGRLVHRFPVFRAIDEMRSWERILQELRPAVVVGVGKIDRPTTALNPGDERP
jgi:hypothetical protein